MRVIINADDCGYNSHVNSKIEEAIIANTITSTTIMANMDDLKGAVNLYKKYRDTISFGFHLNLTEGSPLCYSQLLLDSGFYKEEASNILFNGASFRRRILTANMRDEIRKEVIEQATVLMDNGIEISHIDSHHFMHQSIFMLDILPDICSKLGVYKVRNYRNYMPFTMNRMLRNVWHLLLKTRNPALNFTDWFTSFQSFIEQKAIAYGNNETIELMVHPGGIYSEEENMLASIDIEKEYNFKKINYNQL